MERQSDESGTASQNKLVKPGHPDEIEYDSEDVMIEFIKVECGRNADTDPFISNIDIQDSEILDEQVLQKVKEPTKKHRPFHKTKLNTLRRYGTVQPARDPSIPPALKTKPITQEPPTTFIEAATANQSATSLLVRTEQRLNNLETSLLEINGKLDLLGDQFQSILESITALPKQKRTCIDIGFEKIDSLERLEAFNEDLSQPEYEEKMMQWLEGNIVEERSDYRMTDAMDMLFTRKFLTLCSWTGIGKGTQKIAMMQMTNVTKLFQRIGTTLTVVVNQKRVAFFFMKKLKNAYKRALAKGVRSP
uniref:DUF4806 domain-containing protein n=1 Tax=Anopheles funestus TaxID=62324 RepID=A0A182RTL1_ANOFN